MKVKQTLGDTGQSGFAKYRALVYGNLPLRRVMAIELVMAVVGGMPGGVGLLLRSKLYRGFFGSIGRKVFFGRNVTLRHPQKIRLGDGVIVDDNCVLDAKGGSNSGITIGDGVYVGRNTIIYCKNGDIHIGDRVNISSNCEVFSSNKLSIGDDTVIGAYSYLLSGGEYDYNDATRFSDQSGMQTKGELTVGANCWLGARVTVLDAASIGEHCVLGAGAVVSRPIASHSLAVGVPARVLRSVSQKEATLAEEGGKEG